jgi:hypothetical protein
MRGMPARRPLRTLYGPKEIGGGSRFASSETPMTFRHVVEVNAGRNLTLWRPLNVDPPGLGVCVPVDDRATAVGRFERPSTPRQVRRALLCRTQRQLDRSCRTAESGGSGGIATKGDDGAVESKPRATWDTPPGTLSDRGPPPRWW